LKIYTQVRSEEVEASLPNRPIDRFDKSKSKISHLRLIN